MRLVSVLIAVGLALVPVPAVAAADPTRYMPTQLISETAAPTPGSTILIGFRMAPRAGWHGYWSNPGDAGIAPTVKWTAPPGVSFGPLLHPAPTLISADGISSFVHDGPHILLSQMTVPRSIALGAAIPIKAELSWAACTATQCVPLHATFTLDLVGGDGARSSEAGQLRQAQSKVPQRVGPAGFTNDGNRLQLKLPAALRIDVARARFFPDSNDAFGTARATAARVDGAVVITGPSAGSEPDRISGVVSDGRHSYRLSFAREEAAAPAALAKQAGRQQASVPPAIPSREPVDVAASSSEEPHSSRQWLWIVLAALLAGAAALGWQRLRRG